MEICDKSGTVYLAKQCMIRRKMCTVEFLIDALDLSVKSWKHYICIFLVRKQRYGYRGRVSYRLVCPYNFFNYSTRRSDCLRYLSSNFGERPRHHALRPAIN